MGHLAHATAGLKGTAATPAAPALAHRACTGCWSTTTGVWPPGTGTTPSTTHPWPQVGQAARHCAGLGCGAEGCAHGCVSSALRTSLHSCHSPPRQTLWACPPSTSPSPWASPSCPTSSCWRCSPPPGGGQAQCCFAAMRPICFWGKCTACTSRVCPDVPAQPMMHLPAYPSAPPPRSYRVLPEPYRPLMCDPSSPIVDFYPTEFQVDLEGKREWGHQHASVHPVEGHWPWRGAAAERLPSIKCMTQCARLWLCLFVQARTGRAWCSSPSSTRTGC